MQLILDYCNRDVLSGQSRYMSTTVLQVSPGMRTLLNEATTRSGNACAAALPKPDRRGGQSRRDGMPEEHCTPDREQGADDVLALKERAACLGYNHPHLCQDVTLWLDSELDQNRLPVHVTVDQDHGRIETRRRAFSTNLAWLDAQSQWTA